MVEVRHADFEVSRFACKGYNRLSGVPLQERTAQVEAQGISVAEAGHRIKCAWCAKSTIFWVEPMDLTVLPRITNNVLAWNSAPPHLGCVG